MSGRGERFWARGSGRRRCGSPGRAERDVVNVDGDLKNGGDDSESEESDGEGLPVGKEPIGKSADDTFGFCMGVVFEVATLSAPIEEDGDEETSEATAEESGGVEEEGEHGAGIGNPGDAPGQDDGNEHGNRPTRGASGVEIVFDGDGVDGDGGGDDGEGVGVDRGFGDLGAIFARRHDLENVVSAEVGVGESSEEGDGVVEEGDEATGEPNDLIGRNAWFLLVDPRRDHGSIGEREDEYTDELGETRDVRGEGGDVERGNVSVGNKIPHKHAQRDHHNAATDELHFDVALELEEGERDEKDGEDDVAKRNAQNKVISIPVVWPFDSHSPCFRIKFQSECTLECQDEE